MPDTILSIGGLGFRLILPHCPQPDREIRPFLAQAGEPWDITVDFCLDADIPDWQVDIAPGGDWVSVRVRRGLDYRFAALRGCLMYIPMEEILLMHSRFFLHASLVAAPYGGLLFTGDSGIGKSTQAELWRAHMGSTVINGDRAIIGKVQGTWRAYGSPYAGSSGYYVRQDVPIRAVILLEQAGVNQIHPVSPGEAFRRLLLQISADHTRADSVNRLCDLVAELIADVPVYCLRCTPDIRAVEALRSELERGRRDATE